MDYSQLNDLHLYWVILAPSDVAAGALDVTLQIWLSNYIRYLAAASTSSTLLQLLQSVCLQLLLLQTLIKFLMKYKEEPSSPAELASSGELCSYLTWLPVLYDDFNRFEFYVQTSYLEICHCSFQYQHFNTATSLIAVPVCIDSCCMIIFWCSAARGLSCLSRCFGLLLPPGAAFIPQWWVTGGVATVLSSLRCKLASSLTILNVIFAISSFVSWYRGLDQLSYHKFHFISNLSIIEAVLCPTCMPAWGGLQVCTHSFIAPVWVIARLSSDIWNIDLQLSTAEYLEGPGEPPTVQLYMQRKNNS